jgi:hypothetical protein
MHSLQRYAERLSERTRAWPSFLQEMKRHALRSLRPDSRQGAQRIDQAREIR